MDIDRQRVAAVQTLEGLGFRFQAGEWRPPATAATPLSWLANADDLHGALMQRADALAGCTPGSSEEAALKEIVDVIEAYEQQRWPLGKLDGRATTQGRNDLVVANTLHELGRFDHIWATACD